MVQDKTWTDRTLAERGPLNVRTLANQDIQAKLRARADHGLTKYPDRDHDYDGYQRTYDAAMAETIQLRDHPLPLNYVKKPTVVSQKQLLLNRKKDHWEQSLACKKIVDEGTHKDEIVRLNEREAARTEALQQRNTELLKQRGLTQTKTKKQLDADRAA